MVNHPRAPNCASIIGIFLWWYVAFPFMSRKRQDPTPFCNQHHWWTVTVIIFVVAWGPPSTFLSYGLLPVAVARCRGSLQYYRSICSRSFFYQERRHVVFIECHWRSTHSARLRSPHYLRALVRPIREFFRDGQPDASTALKCTRCTYFSGIFLQR